MPAPLSQPSAPFDHFIGFDVGKFHLIVHDSRTGQTSRIGNNDHAVRAFLNAIGTSPNTLAVCEASGRYEARLLAELTARRIPAHRADAARVKNFVRSLGQLAKTDRVDARALAIYGKERHATLELWTERDREQDELQALVLRRDDLVAMRTQEKNRAQAPAATPAIAKQMTRSCALVLKTLGREIGKIDARITELVEASAKLKSRYDVLIAMLGIGHVSATGLLAHMPELGSCSRRQAASLAGVAPHANESGTRHGYRSTRGGRAEVKKLLFMPALAIARGNTRLSEHYRNLVQNGKKPRVALTAIMRKLIVIANAKLRDHEIQQLS